MSVRVNASSGEAHHAWLSVPSADFWALAPGHKSIRLDCPEVLDGYSAIVSDSRWCDALQALINRAFSVITLQCTFKRHTCE